jgi:hypothetical protein
MPPSRRPDLIARQLAEPPFGGRRFPADDPPVRAGTTGSGDGLLVLAWSATELAAEIAAGTRVLGALGIAAGMRIANTLPGALATPGALLLGDVNEAIGALDVPLGVVENANAARAAWELVDRVECAVLVLAPESAAAFLDAAGTTARPWWQGIVWLDRGTRAPRPTLPAGFGGWQRAWLAVPEASSFVGGSVADDGRYRLDGALRASLVDGELVLNDYATGLRGCRLDGDVLTLG